MVSAIVAVLFKGPEIPATFTVDVPVTAEALGVSVSTSAPFAFARNAAVTPLGRPDTETLTLPLKPFNATPVIVLAPLPPCAMLRVAGDA